MSTTRQLNSTAPYTPWLGHIPDLQYTWIDVPEHLDLGSLDPLAVEIFGRDGETRAAEESIDCYNSSSAANQLPAVADSASSSDIDDDEHAYDNNENFERLLRECIEPEYHLTGSPSSAPLSTTSALDLNQDTKNDAKGFHEVEDASAPSSIRTPSTDEAHTQQTQSLHPQEHGPRFMAMLNDCPALHNGEPGPPYKLTSDQLSWLQPEKGPATIVPSAPSLLQFLVEFFQSRVQAQLEGNKLAPSSTKKKAKKTHGHNSGPSATQGAQAPRRRFKQIFVDPSIPKPKRSETWNICTGQSNRRELLNDDERRELIKKQKEARKSSQ
ncbi:hypothetical protein CPB84DRAFT_1774079 [Gymnopilus junonius]|uniref:Uncharacterized protein n=1 Tax=Gymnopilus junonius TaxID=109634 RepID=A0A9P5NSH2_GYMJU|nr:hypothetical protein CPB84DRAFT_1774079 [Gymnopilus junonius]